MQTVEFTFMAKNADGEITLSTQNTPDAYSRVMCYLGYDVYYMRQVMLTKDDGITFSSHKNADIKSWLRYLSSTNDREISGRAALMLSSEMCKSTSQTPIIETWCVARKLDFSDRGIKDYENGIMPQARQVRNSGVRRTRAGKKLPRGPY